MKKIRLISLFLILTIAMTGCSFFKRTTTVEHPQDNSGDSPPPPPFDYRSTNNFASTTQLLEAFVHATFLKDEQTWENWNMDYSFLDGVLNGRYILLEPYYQESPALSQYFLYPVSIAGHSTIKYFCEVEDHKFTLEMKYLDESFSAEDWAKKSAQSYKETSILWDGTEIQAFVSKSSARLEFIYGQARVRLYANDPIEQLLPLLGSCSFKPILREMTVLGSESEGNGKNEFSNATVYSVKEFLNAHESYTDEQLEEFLDIGTPQGYFPYSAHGCTSREDMGEMINTIEACGFYTVDECDDFGLIYFYDTKQYRTFFKRGEVTYRFDYVPEQAYIDALTTLERECGIDKGCVKLDAMGLRPFGAAELYFVPELDCHIVLLDEKCGEYYSIMTITGMDQEILLDRNQKVTEGWYFSNNVYQL